MSSPVLPIDPAAVVAPVNSRQVHADPPAPQEAQTAKSAAAVHGRHGVVMFGGRTAEFSYDEKAGRLVVKILSDGGEPKEVVRQFPPEEYLAFVARFREMLGVLFDHNA